MRTKALTIKYFNKQIDESYLDAKYARDEAAQYVMTHYKKHPIHEDYYYNEETNELFHVCSPSSNGCYCVYKINPTLLKCRGKEYKVVLMYQDRPHYKSSTKNWNKFVKECITGIPMA